MNSPSQVISLDTELEMPLKPPWPLLPVPLPALPPRASPTSTPRDEGKGIGKGMEMVRGGMKRKTLISNCFKYLQMFHVYYSFIFFCSNYYHHYPSGSVL
ncbi:hypothetical protein E2C01_077089 [Portunus trituberculatus]|uniref:Uncharacterized protein n=1 Tax=Portunus trituberculatus TaxID=210409 RepID=A0A5B7IAG9_PORTR|nr:hypothetical protein [Portunus trituberculatus]